MNSLTSRPPKVGLALGAGGARGFAHIGVLKALEQDSIPIDMIAGASMGAVIGAWYAKERKADALEKMVLETDWKQLVRLIDLNLLAGKGLLYGQKVKELLRSFIGDVRFEDLEIPLAIIAADAQTSEEIIFNEGSVVEAVRASISLPVIFTPVKWGDRFLVDGGIVNPVPVDVVRNMGAEIVIAVNVLPAPSQEKQSGSAKKKNRFKMIPNPSFENTRLATAKKRIDSLLEEHKGKFKVFDKPFDIAKNKVYQGGRKVNLQRLKYVRLAAAKGRIDMLLQENKDKIKVFDEFSNIVKNKVYRGKEKVESRYYEDRRLAAAKKRIDSLLQESKDKTKIFGELSDIVKAEIHEVRGMVDPQTPNIFNVLMQSIEAMEYERIRLRINTADIVMNPDVSNIGTFGFHRGEEAIAQGYKATKDILPMLREKIHSIPSPPL